MFLGVDYYPEQWPVEYLDSDIERISALGANMVRLGEFAWHLMEKTEGNYDFSFFDNVIAKLKEKNIKVMFGTPTATFPAWLHKKHPEIMLKDENGLRMAFGGRRQYCYNSPVYKEYTKKIVTKLLEHYRNEEAIVAWQIDNEFGHEGSDMCFCETCQTEWHKFLEEKYSSIDELNERWGTMFWGQTYNDFTEIPIPRKTITTHNPSLRLDYMRFRSKSLNNYAHMQVDLVRELKGEHQQITTNLAGGFFDKFYDYQENVHPMDFVSWDNYPVWGGLREPIPPFAIAATHDFCRGLKNQNFWIVEQLIGAQGHNVIGYLPRPNQAKMWSYQAFAHGCSDMLYFRWRAATKGAEQFCYGVIDHDNKERRKYQEVKSLFEEIKPYDKLLHTEIKSDVAIVYDYENNWSWKIQQQSGAFDINAEILRPYIPFYYLNTHIDIISTRNSFDNYKVVCIPVMMISDEIFAEKCKKFVENGGAIIFTFRTGLKDKDNNLRLGVEQPGLFTDMAGIRILEIESLQPGQYAEIKGTGYLSGMSAKVEVMREIIEPTTALPLFMYSDKLYEDKACITINNYGKGKVIYIGGGVEPEKLVPLAKIVCDTAHIDYIYTEPGLEVYKRKMYDETYLFVMNHTETEKRLGDMVIEPYGSKIIKK